MQREREREREKGEIGRRSIIIVYNRLRSFDSVQVLLIVVFRNKFSLKFLTFYGSFYYRRLSYCLRANQNHFLLLTFAYSKLGNLVCFSIFEMFDDKLFICPVICTQHLNTQYNVTFNVTTFSKNHH